MKGILTFTGPFAPFTRRNELHADLVSYLTSRMNSNIDRSLDNLFTSFLAQGAENAGKDGIIVLSEGSWYSMPTSDDIPSNSSARRWQAVYTPSETLTISELQLGHSLKETPAAQDQFDTMYARIQLAEPVNYFSNVPLRISWEINLERAP